MTDIEIKTNLYALEKRICHLEEKIRHMVDVGDMVGVEQHLYGDVYETRNVMITHISKAESEDKE